MKDYLGREIEDLAGLTRGQAHDMLTGTTGKKTKMTDPKKDKLNQISTLVKEFKGFQKDIAEAKKYAEEAVKVHQNTYKDIHKLAVEGTKKGSIFTHDHHLFQFMKGAFSGASAFFKGQKNPAQSATVAANKVAAKSAAGSGGSGRSAQPYGDVTADLLKAIGMVGALKGIGFGEGGEIDFRRQMRQVAFATQGITGDTQKLLRVWEDIGASSKETGQSIEVFEKNLLNNLKRGYKTRQDTLKVTKEGLHLGTMIGANADETAKMFMDWHMQLGLSATQTSTISKGVQQIGRETGIVGDNLLGVVKSSEKFLETMKSVGTLTEQSAKSVISLLAEAEKLGVGNQMQRMLEGTQEGVKLMFNELDKNTQTYLFNVAGSVNRGQKMMQGDWLNTKQGKKEFAQGQENVLRGMGRGTGISSNLTFEDVKNLTREQYTKLDTAYYGAYHKHLGDVEREYEATKQSSKTIGERIKDLNKSLKDQNMTADERLNIEKQINHMTRDAGSDILTALSDSAKSATSIDAAFGDAQKKNRITVDQLNDLKSLGMDTDKMSPKQIAMETAKMTAKSIKAAGGKDFTKELQRAIARDDMVGFRTTMEKMERTQKELGIKERTSLDVISGIEQLIKEINDNLRRFVGSWLMRSLQFIGKMGLIAGGIALMLKCGIFSGPGGLCGIGGTMKNMWGWFKGGGMGKSLGGMWKSAKYFFGGKTPNMPQGEGWARPPMLKDLLDKFRGKINMPRGGGWSLPGSMLDTVKNQTGKIFGKEGVLFSAFNWAFNGGATSKLGKLFTQTFGRQGFIVKGFTSLLGAGGSIKKMAGSLGRTGLLSKGLALLPRGLGIVGKGLLKFAGGPVTVVLGAIGGLIGGFKSFSNASEILGVAQDKLTFRQKLSAGAAGTLTGVLNFLTLGLISGLEPTGSLTKGLAKLFDTMSYGLSYVLWPFQKAWELVWAGVKGLGSGIGDIFSGLWSGIKSIAEPFQELWTELKQVGSEIMAPFKEIFTPIKEFFGSLFGTGSEFKVWQTILKSATGAMRSFGTVIGEVLKILGKTLGFVIRVALKPIIFTAKILTSALKGVKNMFGSLVEGVKQWFGGFYEVFAGLFTLDFKRILKGVGDMMYSFFMTPVKMIGNLFKSIWEGAKNAVKSIWTSITNAWSKFMLDLKIGLLKVMDAVTPDWIVDYKTDIAALEQERAALDQSAVAATQKTVVQKATAAATNDATRATGGPAQNMGGLMRRGGYTTNVYEEAEKAKTVPSAAKPVPLTSVHDRMQKQYESAKIGTPNFKSNDLSSIAKNSDSQVAHLMQLHEDMKQIIEQLRPSNTSGTGKVAAASTRANVKPPSSPDYNTWQFTAKDSANIAITNGAV